MASEPRKYSTGEFLFREGDSARSTFIVQKGMVSIRKGKGDGFVEIGKVQPNQVLGELAFFDRLPRSASAVAMSKVEAIEIDFDSLEHAFAQVPPYVRTIMASVAERLRKTNERLQKLEKNVVGDIELVKDPEDELTTTDVLKSLEDDEST